MFLLILKNNIPMNHFYIMNYPIIFYKEKRDYLPIFLFLKVDTIVSVNAASGGIGWDGTPMYETFLLVYMFSQFNSLIPLSKLTKLLSMRLSNFHAVSDICITITCFTEASLKSHVNY